MFRIVEEPRALAVSIKKVKSFLRIDHSADDQELCAFIRAATSSIEQDLRRSLITKTILKQTCVHAPRNGYVTVQLPFPPLLSIEFVEERHGLAYKPCTQYLIGQNKMTPCITMQKESGLVRVQYKAGYGSKAVHVPPDIRHAILIMVADMYENRSIDTIIPSNSLLQMLLNPYRVTSPL
jgi:uncharacterized phiE125 gp8 family phage protein